MKRFLMHVIFAVGSAYTVPGGLWSQTTQLELAPGSDLSAEIVGCGCVSEPVTEDLVRPELFQFFRRPICLLEEPWTNSDGYLLRHRPGHPCCSCVTQSYADEQDL